MANRKRTLSAWGRVEQQLDDALRKLEQRQCVDPFFRGHRDANWKLEPSLARISGDQETIENRLYNNFLSLGGHLVASSLNTWDHLFLMQHHGGPTRLLDWSENFAVSLYFAVHGAESKATVWLLDPYIMNEQFARIDGVEILNTRFPRGYVNYFLEENSPEFNGFPASAIAVMGGANSTRMRSQRAVFTVHRDLDKPLELQCPDAITRIDIPKTALAGARKFLKRAGVNEYSLFPDLDGLFRHLREQEL